MAISTMAQRCLAALAAYDGENEWSEVILSSGWPLDEKATGEADPSYMSDIAVFSDGSRLMWDEPLKEWRAA
jgi:hypothetical protein